MTLPAPNNCWTYSESTFGTALANCASFQEMTSTVNADDAAGYVYGEALDHPLNGEHYETDELEQKFRHIGQVYSAPDTPYGKRVVSTRYHEAYGTAVIYIERLVPEAELDGDNIPQAIHRTFKNYAGKIIDELIVYLRENGGPIVHEFAVSEYGTNPQEDWENDGVWQGASIVLTWGLGIGS